MMPGTDEELDDEWESSKEEAAEGPNSKRATIRVPPVSPSQPPTVRPSRSQVDADELKAPEALPPKP